MSDTEQKPKSVPKPGPETVDRRAARTRRMIKQALTELMHTMRFEDITVQHIIERADVGRSTFYAHYSDKDEVAKELLEGMMESITRGVKHGAEEDSAAFPIAEMFRHLQSQQLSAHGVWQSNRGRDYLFSVGQAYWNRRIERELRARLGKRGALRVPIPVAAQMVTGAATALINWWLKNKMPYSPEEMQEMFDQVMMPGIRDL
ncbi:MAG: TetR/AcrR family transcriptional regulator [Anaerolineales bacterium]|nr:TetR/AcrR family transcriptional regulator [Anaerolineales bacterium]